MKTKVQIFEDAIREFGINAACEFFDVPKHRWEFFRNELTLNQKPKINYMRNENDLGGTGHGDISYSDADPGL